MKTMTPEQYQGYQMAIQDIADRKDCITAHGLLNRRATTEELKREVEELAPGNPPTFDEVLTCCVIAIVGLTTFLMWGFS